jgi:hypothetical protein
VIAAPSGRRGSIDGRWASENRVLGGWLTCSAKISIAEESDKDDGHERREKELAPRKKEQRRKY